MTVNQIYTIVNAIAKQILGTEAITVIDTSTLVSLGKQLDNFTNGKERFFKVINDMVAKTVIDQRLYSLTQTGMVKEPFTYGAIIRKIHIDMPEAKPNNAWNVGESDYTPEYAPVAKVNVRMKLFEGITAFEIDYTIPDNLFNSAFTDANGVAALINGIGVAVENSLNMKLESCIELTRASFIARKALAANNRTFVNVLAAYNSEKGTSLLAADAKYNPDFIRFANALMLKYPKRLAKMSKAYNEEGYERHTDASHLVFDVLLDYAAASSAYLESNVYHDELVKLPNYTEVPYWQGMGLEDSFENNSLIKVSLDGENTVTVRNVIGVMYDDEAMAITMTDRRTTSERNNKDEYTNFYHKANIGYINDLSQNGVVFYIADVTDEVTLVTPTVSKVFEVNVSSLQSGVAITGDKITGTLTADNNDDALTEVWGKGYFIVLKLQWPDNDTVQKVYCGLDPSESSGLVEITEDPDKTCVCKITNKNVQKFVTKIVTDNGTLVRKYDISGLTLS